MTALQSDKGGYYLYLPAAFIYQDLARLQFFKKIDSVYRPNTDDMYGIYNSPVPGNRFVKYSIGTAVCEAPLFLLAHAFSHITGLFTADGYSIPYRISVLFSTILFVVIGLWCLHKFLLRYFPDKAVFAVLILLLFGTNLYFYTTFDPGMSHPFAFSFFCVLLYSTDQWAITGKTKYALFTGFISGMLVLVRPVNLLILLVPLCWQVYNIASLKNRLRFWTSQAINIIIGALVFFAVLLLQMGYWKYATGHWIFFSYVEEGFHFSDPHIWDGLISYRKGWYVYTPVALIATLGLIPLWRYRKAFVPGILLFVAIYIYVAFSWYQWFYGGSFGCRALIDILPAMTIPLCAFIQWGYHCEKR